MWFWIWIAASVIAGVVLYWMVDRELRQYDDSDGPTPF